MLSDWFNRVMKAVHGGNLQLVGASRRACDGQWVMLSQIYTLSNSLPLPFFRYSGLPNKRTVRYCGTLCCLISVPVRIKKIGNVKEPKKVRTSITFFVCLGLKRAEIFFGGNKFQTSFTFFCLSWSETCRHFFW